MTKRITAFIMTTNEEISCKPGVCDVGAAAYKTDSNGFDFPP
ncbi:MAG: hypothetical protein OXC44_01225 [Proteobacteria bacterium]|nr:hypothetical protein [Pseudomonadota bacterium]